MAEQSSQTAEQTLRDRRLATAAVIIWALVLVGIGAHAFLNPQKHSIFPIYSYGAHMFWEGHSVFHGSGLGDEFQNGPLFAVAVTPLAYLPPRWGNMLWKVFNIGIFLVGLWIWLKYAMPEPLTTGEIAAVFLLALGDSMQCVYDGNSNLFVIAAILLGITAVARARKLQAGTWLAAATLAKAFPVVLAALLTVLCGVAVAGPFAAATVVGVALPVSIRPSAGISQTIEWWHVLASRSDQRQVRHCSIDQLFRVLGHPIPIFWSNVMAAVAGLVVLALCVTYARRSDRRSMLVFTLAAYSAWIALFLPFLEAATLAVVAPSVALALVEVARRKSYGILVPLVIAWWLLGPALTDIAGSHARILVQGSGAIPVGGLLFAACVVALWRKPKEIVAIPPQYRRVLKPQN